MFRRIGSSRFGSTANDRAGHALAAQRGRKPFRLAGAIPRKVQVGGVWNREWLAILTT